MNRNPPSAHDTLCEPLRLILQRLNTRAQFLDTQGSDRRSQCTHGRSHRRARRSAWSSERTRTWWPRTVGIRSCMASSPQHIVEQPAGPPRRTGEVTLREPENDSHLTGKSRSQKCGQRWPSLPGSRGGNESALEDSSPTLQSRSLS